MKILVIRIRYLGDALLLRPVLRALRAAHPEAGIDVLVAGGTEVALEGCDWVDRVMGWPRGRVGAMAGLLGRLACAGYDLVVDLTGNDRSAAVVLLTRARVRAGYYRAKQPWYFWRNRAYTVCPRPEVRKPHTIVQHLRLLEACGVAGAGTDLELRPLAADAAWARAWSAGRRRGRTLAAHLSSRDMQKSLPVEMVRGVLERILDGETAVWLTHGPGAEETAYAKACAAGFEGRGLEVVSGLTWGRLVALIDAADAWWGVDTAPMHVASGLGKRMLAHFGPSKVEHWRPLNAGAEVDVARCACLEGKRNTCAEGRSGRCWGVLEAGAVAGRVRGILGAGTSRHPNSHWEPGSST